MSNNLTTQANIISQINNLPIHPTLPRQPTRNSNNSRQILPTLSPTESFYRSLRTFICFNKLNCFTELLTTALNFNYDINFNPRTEVLSSSLLMYACKLDKLPFVEVLLDHGADINSIDTNLYNSLHYTILSGYCDLSAYLILEGIDLEQKNIHNETPIDMFPCFRNLQQ